MFSKSSSSGQWLRNQVYLDWHATTAAFALKNLLSLFTDSIYRNANKWSVSLLIRSQSWRVLIKKTPPPQRQSEVVVPVDEDVVGDNDEAALMMMAISSCPYIPGRRSLYRWACNFALSIHSLFPLIIIIILMARVPILLNNLSFYFMAPSRECPAASNLGPI